MMKYIRMLLGPLAMFFLALLYLVMLGFYKVRDTIKESR